MILEVVNQVLLIYTLQFNNKKYCVKICHTQWPCNRGIFGLFGFLSHPPAENAKLSFTAAANSLFAAKLFYDGATLR
jgi:hypothetical protein